MTIISSLKNSSIITLLIFKIGFLTAQTEIVSFSEIKKSEQISEFIWKDNWQFDDYPKTPKKFTNEPGVFLLKQSFNKLKFKSIIGNSIYTGTYKKSILNRKVSLRRP